MLFALTSLCLLGVVGVSAAEYTRAMRELFDRSAAPGAGGSAPKRPATLSRVGGTA